MNRKTKVQVEKILEISAHHHTKENPIEKGTVIEKIEYANVQLINKNAQSH